MARRARRAIAKVRDVRYGLPPEAGGIVRLTDLGLAAPGRMSYAPATWGVLERVLKRSEIGDGDAFIDLGSGMGRTLLQAARFPFRRVIGIDVVDEFNDIARATLERNRRRLVCKEYEVLTADLASYEIPGDITVVFLFDPVEGDLFDAVVDQLLATLTRNPRLLRVIYVTPRFGDRLVKTGRARLTRRSERGRRYWQSGELIHLYEMQ